MLEHLPNATSSRRASWTDNRWPVRSVSTDFVYPAGKDGDGDEVTVIVIPAAADPSDSRVAKDSIKQARATTCPADLPKLLNCVVLGEENNGTTLLRWVEEMPEEDPGGFQLHHVGAKETVVARFSGPALNGDPREEDFQVSVDILRELVTDPRLALVTTSEVVSAGEAVDDWKGGEPDPDGYDRVPQTGIGLTSAYLSVAENQESFRKALPSRLTSLLGPEAIGGRLLPSQTSKDKPVTVDILATAPSPRSLPDDICQIIASPDCTSHESVGANISWWLDVTEDGKHAVLWVARLSSEHDTVLVRAEGPIEDLRSAPWDLGLYMFDIALQEPGKLGMTTTKETLEWSLADHFAQQKEYEREYEEEERNRQEEMDQGLSPQG